VKGERLAKVSAHIVWALAFFFWAKMLVRAERLCRAPRKAKGG